MSYLERFHGLIDRAEQSQYSPDSGVWLEEAWLLAQENWDIPNAVLARYLYTFAVAPLEPAKALVAFSWCVAHAEEAESALPGASLAQLYGIAIGILRSYPDYSLEQIEATFQEMERQYRKFGLPERDILHHRVYMALSVGDREGAEEWYSKWTSMPADVGACAACDRGTQALYHLHREAWDEGFRLARPLLEHALMCPHGQPLMSHAAVLIPMARRQMFEEAWRSFRVASQMLEELGYAGIWVAGRQLGFLALMGHFDEALAHFSRYASYGLYKGTPADRFGYLVSIKSLALLAGEVGQDRALVSEMVRAGVFVKDGEDARRWAFAQVEAMAEAFDRRNRNGEFRRIVGVFDEVQAELAEVRAGRR